MARLLVALLFATVLMLGWSTGSSYACNEKAAQAADAASGVILAADDADDGDDDDGDDEDGDDDDKG